MTISAYAVTVPVFARMLKNMVNVLEKAETYAAERKFDVNVLMGARLAPDMLPLSFQVQNATDRAKFALSRLAGTDAPSWPDEEKTIAELKERLLKAAAYVESFTEAQLAGSEDKTLTIKFRGQEITAQALDYLLANAMPNFYFHVTAAYAILRHNGVPVGKSDFIGH